jgi:hypothetical protein
MPQGSRAERPSSSSGVQDTPDPGLSRPVNLSAEIVRSLLRGHKTTAKVALAEVLKKCAVGERLWVREAFHPWAGSASRRTTVYVADGRWVDHGSGWTGKPGGITWCSPATPPSRMPRWRSRLTLIVEEGMTFSIYKEGPSKCVE